MLAQRFLVLFGIVGVTFVVLVHPLISDSAEISASSDPDIEALLTFVSGLPSEAFSSKPEVKRQRLTKNLLRIALLFEKGRFLATLNLTDQLLRRGDRSLGGNGKDDWIVDPFYQREFFASLLRLRDKIGDLAGNEAPDDLPFPDVAPLVIHTATETPVNVSINLSGMKPMPRYVILEQLTENGPVPISYLTNRGKGLFAATFPASSLEPDQLLFQVVITSRKTRTVSRRGRSPLFAVHAVNDPSTALALYETFLSTLPPLGDRDDSHLPTLLSEIPIEVLNEFSQIAQPSSMAVMEIGSLNLSGFVTGNAAAEAGARSLLTLIKNSGIQVQMIENVLPSVDLHQEGIEAGGLKICDPAEAVTFFPPGGIQNNTLCGIIYTAVIFDGDIHIIFKEEAITDLVKGRFTENFALKDTARTVIHELIHATKCFVGSIQDEENFIEGNPNGGDLISVIGRQVEVALKSQAGLNTTIIETACRITLDSVRQQFPQGATCLDQLAIPCTAPAATAPTFDFALDWLQVNGNIPGGFFDGFNDGSLTSPPTSSFFFSQGVAATQESGSFLHFTSADGAATFMRFGSTYLEDAAYLVGPAPHFPYVLRDGAGNSSITASFRATVPHEEQFYTLSTVNTGPGLLESLSIGVAKGPDGNTYVFTNDNTGAITAYDRVTLPASGFILFRLFVNDPTNHVLASYSINNGATFIPDYEFDVFAQHGSIFRTTSSAFVLLEGGIRLP